MTRIAKASIEAVVQAADIVELVSARTQLRRVGSRFTGRCPFHEERTPSFSVNATEKLYYCFGCGKGGDLISFVRETEGLDFTGAVEWLADRYRVALELEESSPAHEAQKRRRERLLSLLEAAAVFYTRHLWETAAGGPVRQYLASRGLQEEVCRQFRLGLSPGGRTLAGKAKTKGFAEQELAAVGLVNRRGNDYFAGRLIFPLADARGRVLGFGARRLAEDDPVAAKYLNSPESDLFAKRSLLYGLQIARAAIAKEDRAIVVEGYTDVLALHQAGLGGVVASMGTSLTEAQVRELKRLTSHLYLCFDADAAGEAATLRGMEMAVTQGVDVRVVSLPPGADPADAPAGFEGRLAEAETYLFHRVKLEVDRAADRQEAFVRVEKLLSGVEESPERQRARRYVTDRLDLPPESLALRRPRGKGDTSSRKLLDAGERLERDALAGCIAHPKLVGLLANLSAEHFDDELHRTIRDHLVAGTAQAPAEAVELFAELDARAAAEGIDEETGKELLLRLGERRLERELKQAVQLGETARVKELTGALDDLRRTVARVG